MGHSVQEAFVEPRSPSLRRCGEEVCVLQRLHGSGRQVWFRRPGSPEDDDALVSPGLVSQFGLGSGEDLAHSDATQHVAGDRH
ncbi:hypothetical protein [Streptomyces sp. NPDC005784]|uniref:hypothetical protein n=1 Tax=Streptomyces sp. NPDC005784 TaxID=3364731 RepID=UPI00368B0C67